MMTPFSNLARRRAHLETGNLLRSLTDVINKVEGGINLGQGVCDLDQSAPLVQGGLSGSTGLAQIPRGLGATTFLRNRTRRKACQYIAARRQSPANALCGRENACNRTAQAVRLRFPELDSSPQSINARTLDSSID